MTDANVVLQRIASVVRFEWTGYTSLRDALGSVGAPQEQLSITDARAAFKQLQWDVTETELLCIAETFGDGSSIDVERLSELDDVVRCAHTCPLSPSPSPPPGASRSDPHAARHTCT